MHISIICFSLTGYTTAEKIQKSLQQCGYTADLFKKSKYLEDSIADIQNILKSLEETKLVDWQELNDLFLQQLQTM